jgi:hypothetical protein
MKCYPMAALERTMKIQEVILRALAKKITWWQAAEIIGTTDRKMRRRLSLVKMLATRRINGLRPSFLDQLVTTPHCSSSFALHCVAVSAGSQACQPRLGKLRSSPATCGLEATTSTSSSPRRRQVLLGSHMSIVIAIEAVEYWKLISEFRGQLGRRHTPKAVRELIFRMVRDKLTWGSAPHSRRTADARPRCLGTDDFPVDEASAAGP